MFQNLRQSDTIYVIDTSGVPYLKMGVVVNKSNPIPVTPTHTNGLMLGMNQQMEITLRANVGGQEGDFPHLLTTEDIHDYGNMIVVGTRESALSEIDKLRMKAQSELDRKEYNEKTVASCEDMSKTLNPAYAKEKERDEAIGKLNSRLDGIEDTMSQILKHLNNKK